MIENSVWIENINKGLMPLANPAQGFMSYEFGKLYTMYRNFLEFIMVYLYDDTDLDEFLEKCSKEPIISEPALEKLKQLDRALNDFFEQAKELTEFELIRRKEWDIVIPLAKACLEELSPINN